MTYIVMCETFTFSLREAVIRYLRNRQRKPYRRLKETNENRKLAQEVTTVFQVNSYSKSILVVVDTRFLDENTKLQNVLGHFLKVMKLLGDRARIETQTVSLQGQTLPLCVLSYSSQPPS